MAKLKLLLLFFSLSLLTASPSLAQFPVINGDDVRSWLEGKRNVQIIDTRMPEEYQEAHIPGAINIPAERMRVEAARLPKDKSVPIIF